MDQRPHVVYVDWLNDPQLLTLISVPQLPCFRDSSDLEISQSHPSYPATFYCITLAESLQGLDQKIDLLLADNVIRLKDTVFRR